MGTEGLLESIRKWKVWVFSRGDKAAWHFCPTKVWGL